ncbi:MAG: hypothetical protein JSS70_14910 [Bacteroidetes bacterium]|nr:hypothetical protein [Bacteroidota bacterium]
MFAPYSTVSSVKVIIVRMVENSCGFGFVEMTGKGEANKAITGLNNKMLDDKPVWVSEARSKTF